MHRGIKSRIVKALVSGILGANVNPATWSDKSEINGQNFKESLLGVWYFDRDGNGSPDGVFYKEGNFEARAYALNPEKPGVIDFVAYLHGKETRHNGFVPDFEFMQKIYSRRRKEAFPLEEWGHDFSMRELSVKHNQIESMAVHVPALTELDRNPFVCHNTKVYVDSNGNGKTDTITRISVPLRNAEIISSRKNIEGRMPRKEVMRNASTIYRAKIEKGQDKMAFIDFGMGRIIRVPVNGDPEKEFREGDRKLRQAEEILKEPLGKITEGSLSDLFDFALGH